jgi:GNAT superfamily N-acetyltransferase
LTNHSIEDVRIRVGLPDDAESIAPLINLAFIVERVAFDDDRTSPEKVRELFDSGPFLLAEFESVLIGCVHIAFRKSYGHIGLLSVHPLHEGKGLGRELMGAAEELARQAGLNSLHLRVISPRAEALLPFYLKRGYVQTGTAPLDAAAPSPKVPCHYITMVKNLASA